MVGFLGCEWNGGGYLCFNEVWRYCINCNIFFCQYRGESIYYADYIGFGNGVVRLTEIFCNVVYGRNVNDLVIGVDGF